MNRSDKYVPNNIETKWQTRWEADGLYNADVDYSRQKHYALTMLPYPSGELHIGHWYAMAPSDARARFMRMRGFNVLFPMGFDAFGLPAENAAINKGIHPKEWTYANIEQMRKQLRSMGAMFDWRREAISSDPEYYRWTQWFFKKLIEHGKAYRKLSPVDWCPHCNTTLAREQVWGDDRHCERCETPVVKKDLEQWFFRTTEYAEELLDFEKIDWPERVRLLQTNWIGRSEGASVRFTTSSGDPIEVFTTRPDTLWGATFMVLAPEHPLVAEVTTPDRIDLVESYVEDAIRQSEIQRLATDKEKTGVFTGGYAINPVNNERIPIWIADYVLMTYGTGAIMAVPAHDERDFEFALKYGLPILPVIQRGDGLIKSFVRKGAANDHLFEAIANLGIACSEQETGYKVIIPEDQADEFIEIARDAIKPRQCIEVVGARWVFIFHDSPIGWESIATGTEILDRWLNIYPDSPRYQSLMEMLWSCDFYRDVLYHHEYGMMINSGEFTGTPGDDAVSTVTDWLEHEGIGNFEINYKLRDWLISRQRYWGAPIPVVYCEQCGVQTIPDEQLPVLLPEDVEWLPTGESPLKLHPTWKHVDCPVCDGPAERETDTMDTFMCSSWYHLRYLSPHYDKGPFDPTEYEYWMPVDTYTGGIEHATMHLIYTRYFHKAGRDMGVLTGDEPMIQLRNQGIILGEDSEKMSKSRGNVISPDELVEKYGADTVRAYLMFFARWEMGAPWNSYGIEGAARWIRRVWTLITETASDAIPESTASGTVLRDLRRRVHQTLGDVTQDFIRFEFNTIISSLMELLNELFRYRDQGAAGSDEWQEAVGIYLRMMAPVTPHVAEELWSLAGNQYSIHQQPWPDFDAAAAEDELITLVIQVNGKVRHRLQVSAGISEEEAKSLAMESESIVKFISDKQVRKIIFVPGKLINIVV